MSTFKTGFPEGTAADIAVGTEENPRNWSPAILATAITTAITVVAAERTGTTDTLVAAESGMYLYYTDSGAVTITPPSGDVSGLIFHLTSVGAGGIALDTTGLTILGSAGVAGAQGVTMTVVGTDAADTYIVIGGGA